MAILLGANSSSSSGNDNSSQGNIQATTVTALASGTVDNISVRMNSANTFAGTLSVAIFDATGTGGIPGHIVGSAVNMTVTASTTAYFTSASGAGAAVTNGTAYWIAFMIPNGTTGTVTWDNSTGNGGSGGTTGGLAFVAGALASMPSTWPSGNTAVAETVNAYASSSGTSQTVQAVASAARTAGRGAALSIWGVPHTDILITV